MIFYGTDFRRYAKRILGIICLIIGLWLLRNLGSAFFEMYANAQSNRDVKALFAMGICAIILIVAGGLVAYNPDITKECD
jgi:uncharacterized membrane protein YfcA